MIHVARNLVVAQVMVNWRWLYASLNSFCWFLGCRIGGMILVEICNSRMIEGVEREIVIMALEGHWKSGVCAGQTILLFLLWVVSGWVGLGCGYHFSYGKAIYHKRKGCQRDLSVFLWVRFCTLSFKKGEHYIHWWIIKFVRWKWGAGSFLDRIER